MARGGFDSNQPYLKMVEQLRRAPTKAPKRPKPPKLPKAPKPPKVRAGVGKIKVSVMNDYVYSWRCPVW